MKRLDSIDVLRATAILLMVQVHFADYLAPDSSGPDWLWGISILLGSLAAPIFTFLVGMSLCLSLHKQTTQGHNDRDMAWRTVKRGLLVFVFGLIFLLLIWGPEEVWTWDILTFIGFAIVALFPLRRLGPAFLALLALLMLLSSPWLREWAHYPVYWDAAYTEYHAPANLKGILSGFLVNGYFPVFPWLVFPLTGFATAKQVLLRPGKAVPRWLPVAGLGLLSLGTGGALLGKMHPFDGLLGWYLTPLTFYPASTTYLLTVLGSILLAFWFLHTWLDQQSGSPRWMPFFRRYSHYSLTAYVVHHAVHIWPITLLGIVRWNDRWAYYADAVSLPVALGMAVAFIVLFYILLVRWDRSKGKYSLEWILRRLTS